MAYLGRSRKIRLTTKTVALMNRLALLVLLLLPLAALAQTKPFVREYTYRAGDDDSKNSARAIALEQVKRLLLQEVGTYLESEFSVQIIETVGGIKETARQDILSLTAGITQTKILDEKWDGQSFYLKAEIVVNLNDVMRRLTELKQDRSKYAELQERERKSRAVADSALAEIERLKQELAKARAEADALRTADLKRQYEGSSSTLSAKEYLDNGSAKYYQEDYTGAVADFTRAIELDPNYAVAYNNRGAAKDELKDYIGAIEDCNKAIELDPNYAMAYNNRGLAKAGLQDYRGAMADYTQAIELDPKLALAYNNRGNAKYELKDYMGAMADYTQAIELDPKLALAYYNRGNAKYELKDYTDAIADYTQAIALNPNYALAYYNRGNAKYELKDYTGAIADYTETIGLNPNYVLAYINRGLAKAGLQDYTGAIADYIKAVELDPKLALAYYNLCCVYSLKGETAAALKQLRRALELGFDDFKHIDGDTDLDNIRKLKAFQDLIREFKAKTSKAKANK